MRAEATLNTVCQQGCTELIARNLARIMDIRILDFDTDRKLLTFLYASPHALKKIRNELRRIGCPVRNLITYDPLPEQPSGRSRPFYN